MFLLYSRNDTSYLANQCEEMTVRLGKVDERVRYFEEQGDQHNEMHEKMKHRLKEMTAKMEEQREAVIFFFNFKNYKVFLLVYFQKLIKSQATETLMKTTNLQLMHELSSHKQQLGFYTMPTKTSARFGGAGSNYNMLNDKLSTLNEMSLNLNLGNANANTNQSALNTVRSIIENSLHTAKSK
jgi:hypothetical protein